VRAQYEEYSAIPAYSGILFDRKSGQIRVVSLTEEQADHARYVNGITADIRAAFKAGTGRTLSKRNSLLLYVQMTKDYAGAVLSMIEIRANPMRDAYWEAHPEIDTYYNKTPKTDQDWQAGDWTSSIMRWAQPYMEPPTSA
jgi:hypothetical protein